MDVHHPCPQFKKKKKKFLRVKEDRVYSLLFKDERENEKEKVGKY